MTASINTTSLGRRPRASVPCTSVNRKLEPYFALAEELDIPVLIHTAGIGPYLPNFRSSAGSPLLLEDVLVSHPKLRIYTENAGFPYRDEVIAMMAAKRVDVQPRSIEGNYRQLASAL